MTKKKLVLEVITETLESIIEENEIIQKYETTIPQIELDLILENIRKLYANYRLIDKYNMEGSEPQPAFEPIPIGFEMKTGGEPIQPEPALEPEPVPVDIPQQEILEIPVQDPPPEKPANLPEMAFDLFGGQVSTIADKYRKEETTVNEQISKDKPKDNIASKIRQTPIRELKSVIGLNDKFIFINELFHGNMKAYQETIQTLDQLTNLNDAIRHFTEVKETFDMNEDLDSFRKMVEFIQRKFKE